MAARSRSKEALLLVLAVTTLVTAVFTFGGRPRPVRAVNAAPPPEAGPKAVEVKGGLGLIDPVKTMPMVNRNRNPFAAPPGTPREALVMRSPQEGEPQTRPAPVRTVVVGPAVVPQTIPTFVTAPPVQQRAQLPPAGVAEAPASNKPSLSGIVADASGKPTAIIHEGNQRYFAKAGDTVAGKYRVQSISNQQVVLVAARERLILKMGGS